MMLVTSHRIVRSSCLSEAPAETCQIHGHLLNKREAQMNENNVDTHIFWRQWGGMVV